MCVCIDGCSNIMLPCCGEVHDMMSIVVLVVIIMILLFFPVVSQD